MSRIRSIKPSYWTSEQVMNLTRDARCLFIGMWNFCDDGGNHPASALTLKAEVFPGDALTADQVMVWVDELIEQELLDEYEVGGRIYWHVTGWHHQRIDQPTYRHPKGDAGDASHAGDTGDAGDTCVTSQQKRLGGKQRQLLIKKLKEKHGDACSCCGESSNLSIFTFPVKAGQNPHAINNLRLICATCKRKNRTPPAPVMQGDSSGDARCLDGDSPPEWSGEEGSGVNQVGGSSTVVIPVTHVTTPVDPDESSLRIGKLCQQLRAIGIRASPDVFREPCWIPLLARFDNDLIVSFGQAKRKAHPEKPMSAGYLVPGLQERLTNPSGVIHATTRQRDRNERAAAILAEASAGYAPRGNVIEGTVRVVGGMG